MSKGKRYNSGGEQLNYKKVFAVIIAIVVIIMFVIIIKNLLTKAKETNNVVALDYYALYANNKWGVVSSDGETAIEPMYQEMITIVDNSKDVFICTYDVNEESGEYKTKVINRKNEEIYTEYDKVEALENYDTDGNAWYEKDTLRVQKGGKYGLINLDGKEILSTQYDSIETLKGVENSLIVVKDGKYGLVNTSGATIINPEYAKIEKFDKNYKNGYITIDENKKYGLVSYAGNKILENKYEKIEQIYGENYFIIQEDKKQKVINTNGEVVLSEGYDKITQLNTDGVVFVKDKKYGFMGYDGKVKIKPEYQLLKQINTGILVAKKEDKCGLIDLSEKEKIQLNYTDIYYEENAGIYIAEDDKYNSSIIDSEFNIKLIGVLSELNTEKGYMKLKVGDEYKYYNFKFEEKSVTDILSSNTLYVSKKNGKYGFTDKDGNVVVDYIYDEAIEQNSYGYAAVKKDGLWGAIDRKGTVVVEPKYNLDNNLVVDFIGKWHLGQDLNMNYYCEK